MADDYDITCTNSKSSAISSLKRGGSDADEGERSKDLFAKSGGDDRSLDRDKHKKQGS